MFKEIVTVVEFSVLPVDDLKDSFRIESRHNDSQIRFDENAPFIFRRWHCRADTIKLLRWMADEIEAYTDTEVSE